MDEAEIIAQNEAFEIAQGYQRRQCFMYRHRQYLEDPDSIEYHYVLFEDGDFSQGCYVQIPTCRECREKYLPEIIQMYRLILADQKKNLDLHRTDDYDKYAQEIEQIVTYTDCILEKTNMSPLFEDVLDMLIFSLKHLDFIVEYQKTCQNVLKELKPGSKYRKGEMIRIKKAGDNMEEDMEKVRQFFKGLSEIPDA